MILLICTILELIKRPLFLILYPAAYFCRKEVRANCPAVKMFNPLWWALDDTILKENLTKYGIYADFCIYGKRSAWVEDLFPTDFLRSWYWSAWRNNSINLMVMLEILNGPARFTIINIAWGKSFYQWRKFNYFWLPYLEIWLGGWRLQAGFLTCGRWQVQFRHLKNK